MTKREMSRRQLLATTAVGIGWSGVALGGNVARLEAQNAGSEMDAAEQTAFYNNISTAASVVGGVQIGTAGAAGTPFAGYTMVWGDDFLEPSPSLVSPATPWGKYAPWMTNVSDLPGSNTVDLEFLTGYFTNPNDTGFNDVNRGVARQAWQDIITQANSMLTLKCRLFGSAAEWQWTDRAQKMLMGLISSTPLVAAMPPMIFEARIRVSATNQNGASAGDFCALSSYQLGPMSQGNSNEVDWPDGNGSSGFLGHAEIWTDTNGIGGATYVVSSSVAMPNLYDGEFHDNATLITPTSGSTFYCDNGLVGTENQSAQTYGQRPFYMQIDTAATGQPASWGTSPPNISMMDIDWWRIWILSGNVLRKALVPPVVSVSGCTLAPSGDVMATLGTAFSIVVPNAASLWGNGSVIETVEAMPTSVRAPGGHMTAMFGAGGVMWPPGMSYNSSTHTISGTITDQPGEVWVVRSGTLAGDACLVSRFRICFGPRINTPVNISMNTGSPFTYDFYRDADAGNLLPMNLSVTGLPAGLSMGLSGTTKGIITGTPTATGTATFTVTNCVGQSVSSSVAFGPVTAGSGVACPLLPGYGSLAASGLIGSLDFDNSASLTFASGSFGAGGVVSAAAAVDGTTGNAVQNTSGNRPTSTTVNGRGALALAAASSQYLDWTALITAAGASCLTDAYTVIVIGEFSMTQSGGNLSIVDFANKASSYGTDRVTLNWVPGTPNLSLLSGSPQSGAHTSSMPIDANPHMVAMRRIGSTNASPSVAPMFLSQDKWDVGNFIAVPGVAQTAPAALDSATIGAAAFSSSVSGFVNANISRVLVFNRVVEPYELNIVASWSSANYGTP